MAVFKVQTGLRLDEPTYNRLKVIASQEKRSLNNLIELILQKYLEEYEEQHGPILESQD